MAVCLSLDAVRDGDFEREIERVRVIDRDRCTERLGDTELG